MYIHRNNHRRCIITAAYIDIRIVYPTSTNGEGVMCYMYTWEPQSNTTRFGGAVASEGIGTPKLSLLALE